MTDAATHCDDVVTETVLQLGAREAHRCRALTTTARGTMSDMENTLPVEQAAAIRERLRSAFHAHGVDPAVVVESSTILEGIGRDATLRAEVVIELTADEAAAIING